MTQKAQAALEYLMTYGWALVLIATVVAVLVFITSSPESGAVSSSDPTKIMVKGYSISSSTKQIKLQNITGDLIDVTKVTLTGNYSAASCSLNGNAVTSGVGISPVIEVGRGADLYVECSDVTGNGSGTIDIYYTDFANLQKSVGITVSDDETAPFCGDGSCNGSETASTCPGDCPPVCGDGFCTHDESNSYASEYCPEDCFS